MHVDIVRRRMLHASTYTHIYASVHHTGAATTQRFDLPLVSIVANAGDQAARSHSGTSPSRCLDPDTAVSVSQVVFDTSWCFLNVFREIESEIGLSASSVPGHSGDMTLRRDAARLVNIDRFYCLYMLSQRLNEEFFYSSIYIY